VTLFFVSVLVFVVIRILPGDPALVIMGTEGSPEVADRLRESLGMNRPIVVQYADWLRRALVGDLGVSIQYDVPVGQLIVSRLPVTLPLTGLAALFMLLLALPLGLYAATRHRRPGDYLVMLVTQLGIALPSFWAGLLLILLFSVHLGWVRTARAKGVREAIVVVKHTLRNAMIPIVTVAGLQLGQLMAGSIILESVFALPGLGRLALGAITARDLPLVQGVTVFVASSIVCINFLVDVAYVFLDPRLRAVR
jgi:peptide/nickel transport system permease protein